KSLLPLFEISKTLGHRCILLTNLLRLSLDIRQLVGVSRRSERRDGCCRDESFLHVNPPNKVRHQPSPRTAWSRSFERELREQRFALGENEMLCLARHND